MKEEKESMAHLFPQDKGMTAGCKGNRGREQISRCRDSPMIDLTEIETKPTGAGMKSTRLNMHDAKTHLSRRLATDDPWIGRYPVRTLW